MKILDNGHMQSVIRNTWLVQRWKEVNKILSDAGIKHILLKGMALEYTVYGAKGLRQMTDNDILVKKEDALKAWLLLQKNGFRSEMIKSSLHRKIITDIGKHLPTLVKDGYAVEIHHRLFAKAEKNEKLNEAIDNAVEIDVEETKAYILNDDIHLEYLKAHLIYHQLSEGSQLRLYLDLELIKPGSAPQYPDGFLTKPNQTGIPGQRKNSFRAVFFSLPPRIRFRFLLGDIFPSLKWMKRRHGCGAVKAILLYPGRIGKVMWLLKA
jgi:NOL1/NOP2/fmu family ribosome biogenesis protein